MKTTATFTYHHTGADQAHYHAAEKIMRDPVYLAEVMASMNSIAARHSAKHGHPFGMIRGELHETKHD